MPEAINIYKHMQNKNALADIFISHDWFSKTLLSMGEAVIATDKKGSVTAMNKVAEELTGWSLSESSGKPIDSIFNVIDDETRRPVENPIVKALKENRVILLANHTILIKKDKTQRYIIDSAVPIHNSNSEIIGGALIFRDVTEHTISRKKLAETEGLLKSILGNTSLAICVRDLEGNYLSINKNKEKAYNIKASELIGKDSSAHMTAAQAEESRRTDRWVIEQKCMIEYEQVLEHPDGTSHSYQTSKFPLYDSDNRLYAICTISTDISESKKNIEIKERLAGQDVLKSEIRYDELTKNMPNMFFSLDHLFRITSFNHACEKFTGKSAEEIIGKTIEDAFPEGIPQFLTDHREVMEKGIAKNYISTFTFRESTYTYIVNIYPTERGISVLMTDLTMQKRSEMETLELVDRLQKKNKSLRQFAYTVSHDLRGPIAKVLGLVSLSGYDPEYKINDKTILENVANEVTNLDNMVKDMNTTISMAEKVKKKEHVNFEAELKLLWQVLENEIIESKAVITADFSKAEGMVTVKSYLYSILYNLLSNAIKYRAQDVPLIIHIQSAEVDGTVRLTVKDNGMGIDLKKYGDKIFGLYNRFHGKKIDGKGIGLNLVKAQAESLGGNVEVESDPGHGSTFKISLPIIQNWDASD